MNQVEKMLREIVQARFRGSLQVDFQDGRVRLISKTETVKPEGATRHDSNYSPR